MIIKSFYTGNGKESYAYQDFHDRINIIHSNDNNKGKTIVTQGIMYALGNVPNFPVWFENFKEYYFVVEILNNNHNYYICRKNDCFIVKKGAQINVFDTVNEFKRYYSIKFFNLPIIEYKGMKHMVNPSLFYELFFIPQDGRNTSNIFSYGQYNKENFLEMLCVICDCYDEIDEEEYNLQKTKLTELQEQRKILKNSVKLLKAKTKSA